MNSRKISDYLTTGSNNPKADPTQSQQQQQQQRQTNRNIFQSGQQQQAANHRSNSSEQIASQSSIRSLIHDPTRATLETKEQNRQNEQAIREYIATRSTAIKDEILVAIEKQLASISSKHQSQHVWMGEIDKQIDSSRAELKRLLNFEGYMRQSLEQLNSSVQSIVGAAVDKHISDHFTAISQFQQSLLNGQSELEARIQQEFVNLKNNSLTANTNNAAIDAASKQLSAELSNTKIQLKAAFEEIKNTQDEFKKSMSNAIASQLSTVAVDLDKYANHLKAQEEQIQSTVDVTQFKSMLNDHLIETVEALNQEIDGVQSVLEQHQGVEERVTQQMGQCLEEARVRETARLDEIKAQLNELREKSATNEKELQNTEKTLNRMFQGKRSLELQDSVSGTAFIESSEKMKAKYESLLRSTEVAFAEMQQIIGGLIQENKELKAAKNKRVLIRLKNSDSDNFGAFSSSGGAVDPILRSSISTIKSNDNIHEIGGIGSERNLPYFPAIEQNSKQQQQQQKQLQQLQFDSIPPIEPVVQISPLANQQHHNLMRIEEVTELITGHSDSSRNYSDTAQAGGASQPIIQSSNTIPPQTNNKPQPVDKHSQPQPRQHKQQHQSPQQGAIKVPPSKDQSVQYLMCTPQQMAYKPPEDPLMKEQEELLKERQKLLNEKNSIQQNLLRLSAEQTAQQRLRPGSPVSTPKMLQPSNNTSIASAEEIYFSLNPRNQQPTTAQILSINSTTSNSPQRPHAHSHSFSPKTNQFVKPIQQPVQFTHPQLQQQQQQQFPRKTSTSPPPQVLLRPATPPPHAQAQQQQPRAVSPPQVHKYHTQPQQMSSPSFQSTDTNSQQNNAEHYPQPRQFHTNQPSSQYQSHPQPQPIVIQPNYQSQQQFNQFMTTYPTIESPKQLVVQPSKSRPTTPTQQQQQQQLQQQLPKQQPNGSPFARPNVFQQTFPSYDQPHFNSWVPIQQQQPPPQQSQQQPQNPIQRDNIQPKFFSANHKNTLSPQPPSQTAQNQLIAPQKKQPFHPVELIPPPDSRNSLQEPIPKIAQPLLPTLNKPSNKQPDSIQFMSQQSLPSKPVLVSVQPPSIQAQKQSNASASQLPSTRMKIHSSAAALVLPQLQSANKSNKATTSFTKPSGIQLSQLEDFVDDEGNEKHNHKISLANFHDNDDFGNGDDGDDDDFEEDVFFYPTKQSHQKMQQPSSTTARQQQSQLARSISPGEKRETLSVEDQQKLEKIIRRRLLYNNKTYSTKEDKLKVMRDQQGKLIDMYEKHIYDEKGNPISFTPGYIQFLDKMGILTIVNS